MKALETPKARLVERPVLVLPHSKGAYIVDIDKWDKLIGCILLQKQAVGTDRPIGYWSRTLNNKECAYDTTHLECLTVAWAGLLLQLYLRGCRFTIRTSHEALKWILNLTDLTDKLESWRLRLSGLKFDIKKLTNYPD